MKRRSGIVLAFILTGLCLTLAAIVFPFGRWWELERLGEVPESVMRDTKPGEGDWRVAEWTTWWGKPMDPRKFWEGRVIWNDESAQAAARRHGRQYPPIPEQLTNLSRSFPIGSRYQEDIVPGSLSGGLDGGRVAPFHYTEAESMFWNWFWRTQPKPPSTLEREQFEVAENGLSMRKFLNDKASAQLLGNAGKNAEGFQKGRALEIGMPPEALDDDALFWAYVMKWREQYSKTVLEMEALQGGRDPFEMVRLRSLAIDRKFITEPLSREQITAANAWKILYLRRLRREKVDESYIGAYLEAWKLSATEVFAEEKQN